MNKDIFVFIKTIILSLSSQIKYLLFSFLHLIILVLYYLPKKKGFYVLVYHFQKISKLKLNVLLKLHFMEKIFI